MEISTLYDTFIIDLTPLYKKNSHANILSPIDPEISKKNGTKFSLISLKIQIPSQVLYKISGLRLDNFREKLDSRADEEKLWESIYIYIFIKIYALSYIRKSRGHQGLE